MHIQLELEELELRRRSHVRLYLKVGSKTAKVEDYLVIWCLNFFGMKSHSLQVSHVRI